MKVLADGSIFMLKRSPIKEAEQEIIGKSKDKGKDKGKDKSKSLD